MSGQRLVTMRQALSDPAYFGKQLTGDSWRPWRVLLLAICGETLEPEELATFQSLTNRFSGPSDPVREFVGVIGRRGGKSRCMAVLAAYCGCLIDYRLILAPG